MHPASAFLETDLDTLLARIAAWPFALVIGATENRPHAAHTPVIHQGGGRLGFHLARNNPACQAVAASGHALIVFSGPHDYISPDWYGQADQVPTWNYLSVEAEGLVERLDHEATATLLDDLSAQFERGLAPKPEWTRAQMDEVKFNRLLGAITGFSLIPDRIEGITKTGQNKPGEVRQRAGAALKAAGGDPTISDMMERK